jgi:hypothetical protein
MSTRLYKCGLIDRCTLLHTPYVWLCDIEAGWLYTPYIVYIFPSGLDADSGAICCSSRAGFEARETAKGRFEGRGNTGPVHSTAQYPFEDVVAQRKLCGQVAASHGMVGVRAPECSPAAALRSRGVERQHWEAEAMAEGSLYTLYTLAYIYGLPGWFCVL